MGKRRGYGIVPIGIGFGLYWFAKSMEFQGDLSIEPSDRLLFHGLALVIMLLALGCFLRGLWLVGRFFYKGPAKQKAELVKVFADEDGSFDPDAALARYFERKPEGDAPSDAPPPPRGTTFGRKRS
ncbi:MAG: hypothetical protein JF595_01015 [Sphingomonadales bacterium]|nr:hypothetical protein [Sphingomonadales bacterium]